MGESLVDGQELQADPHFDLGHSQSMTPESDANLQTYFDKAELLVQLVVVGEREHEGFDRCCRAMNVDDP